jgi:hypothetical protein
LLLQKLKKENFCFFDVDGINHNSVFFGLKNQFLKLIDFFRMYSLAVVSV